MGVSSRQLFGLIMAALLIPPVVAVNDVDISHMSEGPLATLPPVKYNNTNNKKSTFVSADKSVTKEVDAGLDENASEDMLGIDGDYDPVDTGEYTENFTYSDATAVFFEENRTESINTEEDTDGREKNNSDSSSNDFFIDQGDEITTISYDRDFAVVNMADLSETTTTFVSNPYDGRVSNNPNTSLKDDKGQRVNNFPIVVILPALVLVTWILYILYCWPEHPERLPEEETNSQDEEGGAVRTTAIDFSKDADEPKNEDASEKLTVESAVEPITDANDKDQISDENAAKKMIPKMIVKKRNFCIGMEIVIFTFAAGTAIIIGGLITNIVAKFLRRPREQPTPEEMVI